MDNFLHWDVDSAHGPLAEISFDGTLVDLAVGSSYILVVDHRAEATFGLAAMPVFEVPEGVIVRQLAGPARMGDGTMLAHGEGFAVEIVNVSYGTVPLAGGYYYGSYDVPDVRYTGTRRGVLA